jgi:rfaE bifunctional protein kinase chain/domain
MSVDAERLRALIPGLAGRRLVVVGDVILDEYLFGRPTRVSREAPVMVLEFARRLYRAGGAANPAVNIHALGSKADLVSVVGDDRPGQTLTEELTRAGLPTGSMIMSNTARTAAKTRVLAEDSSSRQHIVRLDYVPPRPDQVTRVALAERLDGAADRADALLLSDYKGGVVDEVMIARVRKLGRDLKILTAADSQGDLALFGGLDLVKCNQSEAEATVGRSLESDTDIEECGCQLLESLGVRYLVLTRGAGGISAFERGRSPSHVPAANRTEVFDVTGAGDTVIALLTLALTAGATIVEAAQLASIAAGLVVRRLGVATASPAELEAGIGALQAACYTDSKRSKKER